MTSLKVGSPKLALVLFHHNMEVDICAFGVRHIHAAVRREGFEVRSLYVGFDPESEGGLDDFQLRVLPELVQTLEGLKPDVVGFSVFSCYVPIIRLAIRAIREQLPRTIVIAGGPDPTLSPERMLNDVDFLFRGECEEALPIFLRRLAKGEPLDDCPNVWFARAVGPANGGLEVLDSSTVRNPMLPLVQDLDTLAWPDYTDSGSQIYVNSLHTQTTGQMDWYSMMASRGCPYRCAFCINRVQRHVFEGLGDFLRRRSVRSVMEELADVKRANRGLERIYFYDEVFTTDHRWVAEFAASYYDQIRLAFFCQTDPRILNERVLPLLARAGMRWLSMGIQGSPRVARQYYDRTYSSEDILRVGRMGKELGFENIFDLIIDEPFSQDEDRREVLEILLRIPRPYTLNTYSMLYFPGYVTTDRALAAGIVGQDQIEGTGEGCFEWNRFLKAGKDPRILFWECLYDLAANSQFPEDEIRRLADDAGLRQDSRPLVEPYLKKRGLPERRQESAMRMVEHGNTI